ncbi:lysine N(6)-hydroxylase/L-ornithine N(5)-oxygenase family protein [Cellvibrio mixtus]|uniref:lysine N(6)-hydroxylase/L-ornithine N(5)-oxygenase family protein n=1 Tax=Cellvibrio mixtus TaxID=39650 RepID=UPI00058800AE|nr:SidA/IucD/PvdA family monooxygenase [Cellvibrio mixtus]
MYNDAAYDFVAVGVGPFNLGLACLSSTLPDVRCVFLDKGAGFNWHPGMLIDGVTLQSPFLADLVTMADPTSPFSYLNYRKQQGSLFNFFVRENYYLERQEYNRYCQWAASRLDNIRFNHDVQQVDYIPEQRVYRISGIETQHNKPFSFLAKKLVIGVGMKPRVPDCLRSVANGINLHSSHYLKNKARLQQQKKITVIGGGQSGAEIFYDLLKDSEKFGYQLDWVTRAPRFFQMETAKLTLEILCGDYGSYFHALDKPTKQKIIEEQKSVYCGANQTLIDSIYDFLDTSRHRNLPRVQLLPCMNLINVEQDGNFHNGAASDSQGFFLQFVHNQTGEHYQTHTDGLVLSSGHLYEVPAFMEGVFDRIERDEQGKYLQKENWSVDIHGREIFIQNAGFESHGLINQDLGMSCYRNSRILREIVGRDIYPIEHRFAFQSFSPAKDSGWEPLGSGVRR